MKKEKCFAWGRNDFGKLGVGSQNPGVPHKITLKQKVLKAVGGNNHSMVIVDV